MSLSVLRHPGLTWTIDGSDTKGRERAAVVVWWYWLLTTDISSPSFLLCNGLRYVRSLHAREYSWELWVCSADIKQLVTSPGDTTAMSSLPCIQTYRPSSASHSVLLKSSLSVDIRWMLHDNTYHLFNFYKCHINVYCRDTWADMTADMVGVSQVKPSNCFRLHPTSMISTKHLTIPVPGSL